MSDHSPPFQQLSRFIERDMRMSHIYQPVMLRELLRHKGKASVSEIAKALLNEDRSQLEYYEQITKNMVGRVLTGNRGITERDGQGYRLSGSEQLSSAERAELIALCDAKIQQYLSKREDPWSHRRKSAGYVPGTLRYEVLKRAHYRCELCGTRPSIRRSRSIISSHAIMAALMFCLTCKRFAIRVIQPNAIATMQIFAVWPLAIMIAKQIARFASSTPSESLPKTNSAWRPVTIIRLRCIIP